MAYNDYIELLKVNPQTARSLSETLHRSIHAVRNAMDDLEQMGVINKVHSGNKEVRVTYHLSPEFRRDVPRIRIWDSKLNAKIFITIDKLLGAFNKRTAGIRALQSTPEIAAKLLIIGLKAQANNEILDEKEQKKLQRELKQLRLQIEANTKAARNSYQVLQQLKDNPEFWTIEGLKKHFNIQLDQSGNELPKINEVEALTIYQQLIE